MNRTNAYHQNRRAAAVRELKKPDVEPIVRDLMIEVIIDTTRTLAKQGGS